MKIFKFILIIGLITFITTTLKAITVDGYAYLENSSDHSGIQVLLERSAPTVQSYTVYTDASGYFSINVEFGVYNVSYSKNSYFGVWRLNLQFISNTTMIDANLQVPPLLVNVPADFSTIQSAIEQISSGDTILVAPGTYVENINFNGKSIVVGSLTLTTEDTSYISQTIIKGNNDGSVVTFNNGENNNAVLHGLTITNGSSDGINCIDSHPTLTYLNVTNNSDYGINCYNSSPRISKSKIMNNGTSNYYHSGAIYCKYYSSPNISNVIISNNHTTGELGIVLIEIYSNPIIKNVIIANNYSDNSWAFGGANGITSYNSNPIIINTIITNNSELSSTRSAAIYCQRGSPIIVNSVVSNNNGCYGIFGDENLSIFNSVCHNNENGNFKNCGDWVGVNVTTNANGDSIDFYGNIQVDPKFVDKDNGDYHLSNESPCIGAGVSSIDINGTTYYAPSTDFEGILRPNPPGSNPDIGAYENSVSSPVPVELASFQANYNKNMIELNWVTLSETNNIGFQIERSQDGDLYFVIDFVKGHGTTSQPQKYSFVDENLESDLYYYKLKQIDSDGSFCYSEVVEVNVLQPKKFMLSQNFPNPFNPATMIKFDIPKQTKVLLTILNIRGERVITVLDRDLSAGHHEVEFNATDLSSGMYFYKLECQEFVDVRKMLLLR
jgi:hypothetical protein